MRVMREPYRYIWHEVFKRSSRRNTSKMRQHANRNNTNYTSAPDNCPQPQSREKYIKSCYL
eukprot:1833861-Amphidinium_carterae.1